MHELNTALVAVGGLVLVLGLLSRTLKQTPLSLPLLALLLGIVLGPDGLRLLNPDRWGDPHTILEQAARFTLAIGLMGAALRLPRRYIAQQWRSLAVLLGVAMPLMWLTSGLLAYGILGTSWLVALLIGAALCPTDPVVASTIVTGKLAEEKLPGHVRHVLSAESGANDGLGYSLVMLPLLLLTHSTGDAWQTWLGRVVLWEVGAPVLLGIGLGMTAGYLLRAAETCKTVGQHSFLAFSLALTLFSLGAAKLLGTDGILAVFVTGCALDWVADVRERRQEENVQEAVNQFFMLPIFTLFGMMIPWLQWADWGWRAVALVAAVLLLRRLPIFVALFQLVPELKTRREALFLGWFGPIGVAALFYASLVVRHTGEKTVWHIASLLVCASVVAHGMSAAPLTKRFAS